MGASHDSESGRPRPDVFRAQMPGGEERSGMAKKLCKLAKKDKLEKIAEAAREGTYICKKCGRTASDKKYLCKSVAVEDL
jgi:hypothetical protein